MADPTSGPRIHPLPRDEWTDEVRTALGPLVGRDPLDNVFGTFARHPDLFRRYSPLGVHILAKSTLSEREKELAILRIGSLNRCEYEFAQHAAIGRQAGLTDDEIARIHQGPKAAGWSDFDRAILQAADDLYAHRAISDDTWAALSTIYGDRQLLDLVFTVGVYNTISWMLNSCRTEIDKHLSDYPWPPTPDGVET